MTYWRCLKECVITNLKKIRILIQRFKKRLYKNIWTKERNYNETNIMLMLFGFLCFFLFLFEADAICEVLERASSSDLLCHVTLDFLVGGIVVSVSLSVSSLKSSISLSLRFGLGNLTGEPIQTDYSDLHNPSI